MALDAGRFFTRAMFLFASNNFPVAAFPNSISQSFCILPTEEPYTYFKKQ